MTSTAAGRTGSRRGSATWRRCSSGAVLSDAAELDRALEAFLARASPANGARLVARAWLDEGFRSRLLADASAALPELGLSMGGGLAE